VPVIFHADDRVAPVNGVELIGAEAVLARLR
jgi:hypothetical protein